MQAEVRRRVEAALEAVERSAGLPAFLEYTLAALDEYLGLRTSIFMLALAGEQNAYTGLTHGYAEYVLEEYFERWAHLDPLTTNPAMAQYASQGWTRIADLYEHVAPGQRRCADDFLRRTHTVAEASFQLRAGGSWGYLTLCADELLDRHTREALGVLVPEIVSRMRTRLPCGLDARLSTREAQVSELVALGFTNREIADALVVEEDTVKKHVSRALEKAALSNRAELAVAWATGAPMRPRPAAHTA